MYLSFAIYIYIERERERERMLFLCLLYIMGGWVRDEEAHPLYVTLDNKFNYEYKTKVTIKKKAI